MRQIRLKKLTLIFESRKVHILNLQHFRWKNFSRLSSIQFKNPLALHSIMLTTFYQIKTDDVIFKTLSAYYFQNKSTRLLPCKSLYYKPAFSFYILPNAKFKLQKTSCLQNYYMNLELNCPCDWGVTTALERGSKFSEIFVADFLTKSDGDEIYLFLLKHDFKLKTLKIIINCFIYKAYEKEATSAKFSTKRLFWKSCFLLFSEWFSETL